MSHLLSSTAINNGAFLVGNLISSGLLRDQEGAEYLEEIQLCELHEINGEVRRWLDMQERGKQQPPQ